MATRKIVTDQNNFNENEIDNFMQSFFPKKSLMGQIRKTFLVFKFKVQSEEKLLNDQNLN
jgi:hypothetical protein